MGKDQSVPRQIRNWIEEMFNAHEFWYPYHRLKEAGAEVVVVGTGSAEIYHGKPGTDAKPDVSADQVSASDCHAGADWVDHSADIAPKTL